MQRSFVRVFAVLAASLLLLSACSDDDGDLLVLPEQDPVAAAPSEDTSTSTPSTTTSTPTTTSTTAAAPTTSSTLPPNPAPEDGEDFDRYIAGRVIEFYDTINRAFENPSLDPEQDYPQFADLAAGEQLDRIYESLANMAAAGNAVREPADPVIGTTTEEEFRISATTFVEAGKVTVLDCEVDDEDLVHVETGEILSAGVLTILRRLTFEEFEDEWKVTYSEEVDKLRGIGGCFYGTYSDFPY